MIVKLQTSLELIDFLEELLIYFFTALLLAAKWRKAMKLRLFSNTYHLAY
jgi:hypothetical protein